MRSGGRGPCRRTPVVLETTILTVKLLPHVAEAEGFEPSGLAAVRFQGGCIKPLCHTSITGLSTFGNPKAVNTSKLSSYHAIPFVTLATPRVGGGDEPALSLVGGIIASLPVRDGAK